MADYSEKYHLDIDVRDEDAKTQLAKLETTLQKLEKNKPRIQIAVSDSKAKDDLASIFALAEKLDKMRVNIHVAVNGDKQVIAQLSAIQKISEQSERMAIESAKIRQEAEAQANSLAERTANNNAKRMQTEIHQAQRLADIRADKEAKLAQRQPVVDEQVGKLQLQQEGQMVRNAQSLINLQNKLANQGNVFTTMGKGLSQISTQLGSISNVANTASTALAGVAKPMLMLGGGGALAIGGGIANQVKGAMSYAMEVEQAQNLLKAQGISAEKVASTYKDIRKFSSITPFGIKDMTESVAAINSYVGDIDTATKATKIFGTSLFATGQDASSLYPVGVNLGQLYSGAFGKADFKEVLRHVPTAGQALRDAIGGSNWEDFNKALGDNPNTKEIERTGNALEFLMDVMDKYNKKTNALEQANESLVNKWANTQEAFKNSRQDALMASGAYTQFGKLLDTLGDKMADPSVQKAFTDLFKGSIPIMQKAQKAINDFDITKFVNSTKRGFDMVKKTVSDLWNNPAIKFGRDKITKLLGLEGGAENIGADLGKILSKGIQLGVGSISLKGIALGTRGLAGLASVGGSLATMIGKGLSKSSAKKQIAEIVGSQLSTSITEGVQLGADKALAKTSKSTATKGIAQKIGAGLSAIGGGLVGLGAGMAVTGAGTFVMSRSIRDVSDTIQKISDDMPTDLADINALNSKINNFVKWANELGSINLGGKLGTAIATTASTMTAIGGAVAGAGNIPAGVALMGAGILTEAIQTLQAFNEKLKFDNINKLVDLPAKLDAMPNLDGKAVATKIGKLDSTVSQIMTALRINKTVEAGQVTGATSTLATNMDIINRAFPEKLTSDLSKTFTNLNNFVNELGKVGDIKNIGDKAVKGFRNLNSTITKLTSSDLFAQKGGTTNETQKGYSGELTDSLNMFNSRLDAISGIDMDGIITTVGKLKTLMDTMNSMPNLGKTDVLTAKMKSISLVMNGIKKAFQPLSGDGGDKNTSAELIDTRWMDNMVQSVNKLMPIMQTMNSLPEPKDITPKIDMVRSTLEKIQMAFRPVAIADGGTTELIDTRWMNNMIVSVNKVMPIIQAMIGLPEPKDITPKVTMIRQVMIQIQQAFASQGGDLVDTRWMDNMISSVNKLMPVMQELVGMPDPATIIPKIDAVQMVLQRLQALSAGNNGNEFTAPNFSPMISQLSQLNIQIQQVASQKGSVDALASAFPPIAKNADTATSAVNRLKSAINSLPTSKSITITVNDQATSILNGIVTALGNIQDKSVTVTTNKVTKEHSATGGIMGSPSLFAKGGMVSRLFKNSSRTFSQGQDTIHALLSQGEAVLRRSAVARVGTSFVENLNHGNLQGAYQNLSNRIATSYNKTVANNQTYNNSPQYHQHFYGSQAQGDRFIKQNMRGIGNV